MRKEARLLKEKATNSLLLAIEHFNRPWDRGRTDAVLHFLDHAFEMLLKAALVQRGGRIREPGAQQTLGFDACVRKALSDANVSFLTDEQALTLQMINALRDASQHYLLELSEEQLYVQAQGGVTLFSDLLKAVFNEHLTKQLPDRVLPISTRAPSRLDVMMRDEVAAIQKLLHPRRRRRVEAKSRARAIAIMEASVHGERVQPSDTQLNKVLKGIREGRPWTDLFPGVAVLSFDVEGDGIPFTLRFAKHEGVPVQPVPEGTPGTSVVAIRRVNELDYYNLGLKRLAANVGLTAPKTLAVVEYLDIQDDAEYYKTIRIGNQTYKRYSRKALEKIRTELPKLDLDVIWKQYGRVARTRGGVASRTR